MTQLLQLSQVTGRWHCTVSRVWFVRRSNTEETLISSVTSLSEVSACALFSFFVLTAHFSKFPWEGISEYYWYKKGQNMPLADRELRELITFSFYHCPSFLKTIKFVI